MNVYLQIAIILLLILTNGFLSMAEMSLVSARKVRLRQLEEEGDARATLAITLAEEPNRFLSTVQIGITLIGILTGTFGGASLSARMAEVIAIFMLGVGIGALMLYVVGF